MENRKINLTFLLFLVIFLVSVSFISAETNFCSIDDDCLDSVEEDETSVITIICIILWGLLLIFFILALLIRPKHNHIDVPQNNPTIENEK